MASYWESVKKWARQIHNDGCTGVKDWHVDCCDEHDLHYYFGCRINPETGEPDQMLPITCAEANAQFRKCIQSKSRLGRFSPLSWVRYVGVSVFGPPLWNNHRQREKETK